MLSIDYIDVVFYNLQIIAKKIGVIMFKKNIVFFCCLGIGFLSFNVVEAMEKENRKRIRTEMEKEDSDQELDGLVSGLANIDFFDYFEKQMNERYEIFLRQMARQETVQKIKQVITRWADNTAQQFVLLELPEYAKIAQDQKTSFLCDVSALFLCDEAFRNRVTEWGKHVVELLINRLRKDSIGRGIVEDFFKKLLLIKPDNISDIHQQQDSDAPQAKRPSVGTPEFPIN
jgi:hypothetical protein